MALRIVTEVRIQQVAPGGGSVLLAQNISNIPGIGQGNAAGPAPNGQELFLNDAEMVPGTPGSYTLANVNTAIAASVTAIAGASGTPKLTPALLAQVNAWKTGGT